MKVCVYEASDQSVIGEGNSERDPGLGHSEPER